MLPNDQHSNGQSLANGETVLDSALFSGEAHRELVKWLLSSPNETYPR